MRRLAEADRVGEQPLSERIGHVRHDKPRVQAAREKGPQRHFAFETVANRRPERLVDRVHQKRLVSLIGPEFRDVPVAPRHEASAGDVQPMPRRQLVAPR